MTPHPRPPITLDATAGDTGHRLDVFVVSHIEGISRARAQQLIRNGCVTLDGRADKPSAPLTAGSRVLVTMPDVVPSVPASEDLPIAILYEDADMAVIDKAAGMVVHPSAGHASGTLVNALLHRLTGLSGIGGEARPGIVHRLDKGTSGVMVVAKHDRAHEHLAKQFQNRTVRKDYQALVWGRPRTQQVFDQALGRDPRNRRKISARAGRARTAVTTISHIEPLDGVSLLELTIGTGRTHQIRVHLAEAGFPVVGDELYGGVRKRVPTSLASVARLARPFLHARRLAFAHPTTGVEMTFEAPLPSDLVDVLHALRRRAAAGSPE